MVTKSPAGVFGKGGGGDGHSVELVVLLLLKAWLGFL